MASKSTKAKAKAARAAPSKRNTVWPVITQLVMLMGLLSIITTFGSLAHNCYVEKPWIPKTESFCSDVLHFITKHEFRKNAGTNFGMAVRHFQNHVINCATPYVLKSTEFLHNNFEKYGGEYYNKSINMVVPNLRNFFELVSNVLTDLFNVQYEALCTFGKWVEKNKDIPKFYYNRVVDVTNNFINAH